MTIRSIDDGVVLLPLVDDATASSLTLSEPRVAKVIAQAANSLDVVILDAGPLDPATLLPGRKPCFDAAVVVCDLRQRSLEEAEAIARQINAAGVDAVGIAENFCKP